MNDVKKTIGYNAVADINNPDEVRANGPFLCKRDDAWLGVGYYFWERNEDWGHKWGRSAYGGNYMLFQSDLELSNLLNLFGDLDDLEYFSDLLKLLKEEYNDDIPVGRAIEYLKQISSKTDSEYQNIFDFDSVRIADWPPKSSEPIRFTSNRRETLFLNPRVQICVIDKQCVETYELIYPEHYL